MATKTETAKANLSTALTTALDDYNNENQASINPSRNWDDTGTFLQTFTLHNLFPKINSTDMVQVLNSNTFDRYAKQVDNIGQMSEEYIFTRALPTGVFDEESTLMLEKNYPRIRSRLYSQGVFRKVKFTINNSYNRFKFKTFGDGIKYNMGVYRNAISGINVFEESEIKAMLLDHAINVIAKPQRKNVYITTSFEQTIQEIFNQIQAFQRNSNNKTEFDLASIEDTYTGADGLTYSIDDYVTSTNIKDIQILSTIELKTFVLNSVLRNSFIIDGIDLLENWITFEDLGGNYIADSDITVSDATTLRVMQAHGLYNVKAGHTFKAGTIFTWNVSQLSEFAGNVTELKPVDNNFAYVFDANKVIYNRDTQNMLDEPFRLPESKDYNYWLWYYTQKQMSYFFNSAVIGSDQNA